jgi:hypothetical protein
MASNNTANENRILLKIADQLRREEEEIQEASEIAEDVIPLLDELEKRDIIDPVFLKIKLFKLFNKGVSKNKKYQDAIYGLFRISVGASPAGSFVILDARKAFTFINTAGLKIIGLTKKIISTLKETPHHILNPLCDIVNVINNDKLNKPLKDIVQNRGAASLVKESKNKDKSAGL